MTDLKERSKVKKTFPIVYRLLESVDIDRAVDTLLPFVDNRIVFNVSTSVEGHRRRLVKGKFVCPVDGFPVVLACFSGKYFLVFPVRVRHYPSAKEGQEVVFMFPDYVIDVPDSCIGVVFPSKVFDSSVCSGSKREDLLFEFLSALLVYIINGGLV